MGRDVFVIHKRFVSVHEVIHDGSPDGIRVQTGQARETSPVVRVLGLWPCDRSASPPRRSGGERRLGIEFSHTGKILMEILGTEVRWSFLDGAHTDVPEVTRPDFTGKGTEALCLEACKTSPCVRLFIWMVGLDSSQYNCNYKYSTLLSSVSHSRELSRLTVVIRNPHICSSWVRYAGDLGTPS